MHSVQICIRVMSVRDTPYGIQLAKTNLWEESLKVINCDVQVSAMVLYKEYNDSIQKWEYIPQTFCLDKFLPGKIWISFPATFNTSEH